MRYKIPISLQLQRDVRCRSSSVETRSVASINELVTSTACTGARDVDFSGSSSSRADTRGTRRYCSGPYCNENCGFSAMIACAHLRTAVVERRFFDRATNFESPNVL